jgi:hypothetical protein
MKEIIKLRRIKCPTKRKQVEVEKINFGKFNLENEVIHDAHKVICNRNLRKIRRSWAFSAQSAILALKVFELKIVKLRRFFRRFRHIRRYRPPFSIHVSFMILQNN